MNDTKPGPEKNGDGSVCFPSPRNDKGKIFKLNHYQKNYHEGEQAARRFERIVKQVVTTSPAEMKKRDEIWRKDRKDQQKHTRPS